MADRVDADKLRDLQSVTDAALAYLPLEELLDELLTRVAEILEVDTAAILLLEDDGRTLVPRAAKGLEEEVERRVRIPVTKGFAGRIAATGQAVRIDDVDQAEIFNPLLREKGLKSLLGVPLMVEGQVIGVLHVGSLYPRRFTDDDVDVLQRAGDRAALGINGRLAERERGLADAMQRSLIPQLPELPGLSLEARYLPAAEARLGGDWYDAFPLPGGKLGVAIGDVSGRGFHAAALMGQLRSGLRACAMGQPSPAATAERLSRLLRQLEPGRTATLLYLSLDPHAGRIEVTSAGHPPPLIVQCDGSIAYLELPTAVPLGAVRHPRYEDVSALLEPGAELLLYTDGVIERPGEPLEAGFDRLREVAAGAHGGSRSLCDAIVAGLLPNGAIRDDAAVLVARSLRLSNPLALSVPANLDTIPILRKVLSRWLRESDASPTEIDEISLATSEACANAIEHAYAPGPASLEVSATVSEGGEAVVCVRDFGSWREPRGAHRGRGTVLMNGLMDAVDIDPGEGGTVVRMTRKLGAANG
jgi:anti-sigma regulatory factor (Ser/Thr protein kinase)/putative methionine-R-sulfoxide reductase with GAF domain